MSRARVSKVLSSAGNLARKKPPNAGKGRKRGVPNMTTRTVREIFTLFVERNAEGAQGLYDRIAKKNPVAALSLLAKISEFVLPKLNRTEVRLPDLSPLPMDTITTAESATAVYLQLMGDPSIDASQLTFAAPSELPLVTNDEDLPYLQEQPEILPMDEPVGLSDFHSGEPQQSNVVRLHDWERLGK
jgi:hypothetical protein